MSTYNVLNDTEEIDTIVFAKYNLCDIRTYPMSIRIHDDSDVSLYDDTGDMISFTNIINKEHAENMIKALQKSIELGWYDEK